ncbi:hypothetical protein CLF_113602, partial [Clonorchis sinensis]
MNNRMFSTPFTIPLTLLLLCRCWTANAEGLIEALVEYNFNETRALFEGCCPTNVVSGGHEDSDVSATKGSGLCSANCSLHLELCLTTTRQSNNFFRSPSNCSLGRNSVPVTIDSPASVKLPVPVEGSSWLMEFDVILRIVKEDRNKSRSVLAESRWTENNLIKTLPTTSVPNDLGSNFVHRNVVMWTPLGENISVSLHYRLRCKRHFYGQGCGVFCHGQRGTHGNYECDPDTGHVVCLDGWRGDRCTE